jgi:hypothetical protein
MRQFRLAIVALLTSVLVVNTGFLRKTIAVLLCGILSFNSFSCYNFLDRDGIVNAAVPQKNSVVASGNSSTFQRDEQKIADVEAINIPAPVKLGSLGGAFLIGYAIGRGAQALIIAYRFNDFEDCGNAKVANSPTPYPKELGLPEYYKFRYDDFVRRNPGKEPPDYYLDFGERNLRNFMTKTYNNPKLTSAGRKFLDTVRVSLQKAMEDHLKKCPGRFAQLENDPYVFRQFAYLTHINAYCNAGWGNLPEQDRDIIIGDVKWSDKYDPSQVGGWWSGAAINNRCGSWWDVF